MTLVTLRPNAVAANTGVVTGFDAATALFDNNVDTYVTYESGQFTTMSLDDLTLPVGAVLLSLVVRIRTARVGQWVALNTVVNGIVGSERSVQVNWSSPTTIEMAPRSTSTPDRPLTDALIDAASLYIAGPYMALRVYEAYLDVRYVLQPVVTVQPIGT